MRWLIDGYNVIRRSPELAGAERASLESGRAALCRLLAAAARISGDRFTIVFDGAGQEGTALAPTGVDVLFSSARESADRVLARLATRGGAVVSNDREVRRAAARAGAIAVSTDDFLTRLERLRSAPRATEHGLTPRGDVDPEREDEARPRSPTRGNPRRLPKKRRAAARALGRLGRPGDRPG
jgi:uncharacterized protein